VAVSHPYESALDRQIRLAAERGAFDDLPGKGKPLPGLDEPDDELWWVRRYLDREGISRDTLLPPSVQLRKELDRLPETLRELPTEAAVRDAVGELNLRVVEHLRAPSGPRVRVGKVDVEDAVRRWREGRRAPEAPPARPAAPESAQPPEPPEPSEPRPRRRWFRRR
jgi:hypothetical protein